MELYYITPPKYVFQYLKKICCFISTVTYLRTLSKCGNYPDVSSLCLNCEGAVRRDGISQQTFEDLFQ